MRFLNLFTVLVLSSFIFIAVGCDSDDGTSSVPSIEEDLQGTWILTKHEINVDGNTTFLAPPAALVPITMVLNADGTYSWTRGSITTTGEWSVSDGMITLNNNEDSEYFVVLWETQVVLSSTETVDGVYTIIEYTFDKE